MQEEVNQKTVALSIRTTKLTGKVLAAALGKVVRALQKHHMWPEAYRSASLPDGAFFSGSVWTFSSCSRMVCKIEGFF